MASWIIHLRVAQELMERTKIECVTEFIMGNIAPDSGVPNEDGSGFVPSSEVSHYNQKDENGIKGVHEELFIEKYLTKEARKQYTKEQYTFYLGYLTHLLADKCGRAKLLILRSRKWRICSEKIMQSSGVL